MGFRKDAYATCWEAKPVSDTMTSVQLSVSKKDKEGAGYIQDFSGFVAFVGTATAKKAAKLSKRDRIKLGDVDVTTKYDKDKNKTYTNFTCFNFEAVEGSESKHSSDDVSMGDVDDLLDEPTKKKPPY